MKKVSIITLSLVMLINSGVAFSAPRRRRAMTVTGKSSSRKINKTESVATNTLNVQNTVEESKVIEEPIKENVVEEGQITENTIIEAQIKESVISEEQIKETKTAEIQKQLGIANTNLQEKINNVRNSCSGIKKDLDVIFGLNVATTTVSGLGTLASGGALVVGLMKAKTDKNIEEITKKPVSSLSLEEMKAELESIKAELDEQEKKSKTLGNVRTGLMAGSIATSAASMGTSIASSINAKKLAEKMKSCNDAIDSLKMAKSKFVADIDDLDVEPSESSVYTKADDILNACKGYDKDNIKQVQTMSTASAVTSGIGTATSIAGTITSALANSKKVRDDDSEKGVKKEKGLNIASNVMAGITAGTSGASTVLSAVSISKAKKDSEMAKDCENILK